MPGVGDIISPAVAEAFQGIMKPISDMITNKEEKAAMLIKAAEVRKDVNMMMMQVEQENDALRRDIIVAEAKSESWLTRTWRPIAMITFISIFPATYATLMFGGDPTLIGKALATIPDKVWVLITVGIGGYIPMRSFEKAAKNGNGNGLVGAVKDVVMGKKARKREEKENRRRRNEH